MKLTSKQLDEIAKKYESDSNFFLLLSYLSGLRMIEENIEDGGEPEEELMRQVRNIWEVAKKAVTAWKAYNKDNKYY